MAVLDGRALPEPGRRCSFISRKFTAGFGLEEVVQWFVNFDPLLKTRLSSSAVRGTCRSGNFSQFVLPEPFYQDRAANLRSTPCEHCALPASTAPCETSVSVKDFTQG